MPSYSKCPCGNRWWPPGLNPLCVGCRREARGLPRFRPMTIGMDRDACLHLTDADGRIISVDRMDDR